MSIKSIDEGINIVEAKDGEQGIAEFLKDSFDLIITDFAMPKLDGFGLIKKGSRAGPKSSCGSFNWISVFY